MKNPSLRTEAEKLRDAGHSYNMIHEKLRISKSTLSEWFKNRPFTPNKAVLRRIQYGPIKSAEKSHNKKVAEVIALGQKGAKEIGILSNRDLQMLGLGLYIGEGSKTHEIVRIINADPNVIRLAIKWFKETLGLADDNITIALHLYPDNNAQECLAFWQKTTKLPPKNFRKTQVDRRQNKSPIKRAKLPYGTAHITIISKGNPDNGVRLHRRLTGWIHGALSQT